MRFGFVVPFADTREFADIAALGEACGWDAVFTWEALYGVDAWVTLGAAAMVTERIRLGTLLTPVSRVRPWDLASRVGTVDRLSRGRVILGAGLGALHQGWTAFEPDEGRAARATKLDESLAIYAGLLAGQPFSYDGVYYSARPTDFNLPDPPVQRPHPPVWVVGAYRNDRDTQPSLDRAARWEGLLPQVIDVQDSETGMSQRASRHVQDPDELARIVALVRERRTEAGLGWEGYDVVIEADSSREFVDLPGTPSDWAGAGATWWVESWWSIPRGPDGLAEVRRRVSAGPQPH
jgi:alkanesulfonate monooxygenase SsuD/methylene tetrahydromethanopterin reductase-like flavin-dependent oxidoreductase (luciferase family)